MRERGGEENQAHIINMKNNKEKEMIINKLNQLDRIGVKQRIQFLFKEQAFISIIMFLIIIITITTLIIGGTFILIPFLISMILLGKILLTNIKKIKIELIDDSFIVQVKRNERRSK